MIQLPTGANLQPVLGRDMGIPEGWTDDMSISLPVGLATEQVVDVVLARELACVEYAQIHSELIALGLSSDDAELAHDRVLGGLVRAGTVSPENEPRRSQDPIAWVSYHRGKREPELFRIVQRRIPQFVPASSPRPRWRFWR